MQAIFVYIYCLPLWHTAALIFIFAGCWRWMVQKKGSSVSRKAVLCAKAIFAALLFLWGAAILWQTILSRNPGVPSAHWEPFYQLRAYFAGGDRELLRTLWMNLLLFIPGGFMMAAVLPRRWRSVWLVLAFILLTGFSAAIEAKQFCDGLGLAETDDILCNGLGAILGITIEEFGMLPAHKKECKQ